MPEMNGKYSITFLAEIYNATKGTLISNIEILFNYIVIWALFHLNGI